MRGLVYIHVPKCGGSSFGAALRLRHLTSQATIRLGQGRNWLPEEARRLDDYAVREAELARHLHAGLRCISGHVRYAPHLHDGPGKNYLWVTLLRDPVARFVSHYHYLQRHHPDPRRPARLEAFLDTRDAHRLASQLLFYFGGTSQDRASDVAARLRRAKTNLAQFDLVGDLSDTAAFARDLSRLAGVRIPQWRRNRAPAPTRVPKHLRAEIEALCAADIEIWHSALPWVQAA